MVMVTLELTEGKLVAWAVMVTVLPLGMAAGAEYVVMIPVEG